MGNLLYLEKGQEKGGIKVGRGRTSLGKWRRGEIKCIGYFLQAAGQHTCLAKPCVIES